MYINTDKMTDAEIDQIHVWVDEQFRLGNFETVNNRLDYGPSLMKFVSETVLLTWLTATLPAKSKLPNRVMFYNELSKRHSSNHPILQGLE